MQSATVTGGADNASGTHHPCHYIRGFCRARDRLRVEGDLTVAGSAERAGEPGGRRFASSWRARDRPPSLPAETVLRCARLKQQRQLSYEELAFHLEDSASFRAFARLPLAWSPKKSVLHQTISAIRSETWEAVNRALLASAKQDKLESGVELTRFGGHLSTLRRRCHRCRRVTDPMRRNSGDRWLIWSDLGEHRRSCRASSNRLPRRSGIGFVRPIATRAADRTARPAPSARS